MELTLEGPGTRRECENLEWLEEGKHPLDWNGPTGRIFARFGEEDLDRSIIDHFEGVVRRHSDRIAIADSNASLSFGQLWDGLSGLAAAITAETQRGELIGILLPADPMFPLAMLACLAAGRPFVALDTHYPRDWLEQVLQDARPNLLIACEQSLEALKPGPATTRIINLSRLPERAGSDWRPAESGLDEPACVLFTSGSTGRPKGIVNSQRNLLQRVAQSINAAHINAEDKFLTLAPLCTIVGVRDITTALLAGASIHLLDAQRTGARHTECPPLGDHHDPIRISGSLAINSAVRSEAGGRGPSTCSRGWRHHAVERHRAATHLAYP